MNLPLPLAAGFALACGCAIAVQAAANGRLGRNLGDPPWAAVLSLIGSFSVTMLLVAAVRPPAPTAAAMRNTEWWNWVGGPLGVVVVASGAILPPRLGAAAFICLVVAGQMLCSLALDHFGLMGLAEARLSVGRVAGVLLIAAGVVCVKYL
jgi:transporter family-2 protein